MKNLYFRIKGKIPPKKNLYHIGRGRFYPDQSVEDFVKSAFAQIKKQLGSFKPLEGPLMLNAVFMTDDRPDLDNLLSGLLDALQECRVFHNDRQVRRIDVRREKVRPNESLTWINLVYGQK